MNRHWRLSQIMMADIAVCAEVESVNAEYRARTSARRTGQRPWRIEDTDEIRNHLVRDIEDDWAAE